MSSSSASGLVLHLQWCELCNGLSRSGSWAKGWSSRFTEWSTFPPYGPSGSWLKEQHHGYKRPEIVFFFPPHGVWAFSLEISWEAQVTRESVGVEPQLFTHIDKSQTRWLRHLIRLPPGHLPGEVFQAHPKGMRPRWRLRTCGRDHLPADLWILLGSSANWTKWPTFPAKTDETQIRLAEDNRWLGNKC